MAPLVDNPELRERNIDVSDIGVQLHGEKTVKEKIAEMADAAMLEEDSVNSSSSSEEDEEEAAGKGKGKGKGRKRRKRRNKG